MINRLQKKYALSVQGAKDLFKAIRMEANTPNRICNAIVIDKI